MMIPVIAIAIAGCSTPSGGESGIDHLSLRIGQQGTVSGGFTVRFDSVAEDSRCPTGLQCVWAGNCVVALTYTSGDRKVPFTLESYDRVKRDTIIDKHRIELLAVSPYPDSVHRQIPPGEYVVELETYE